MVLFGANGSGKTNFLEALSFLSPGRGMRRARLEDLARRNDGAVCPAWGVQARLGHGGAEAMQIAVGQVPEAPGRRIIRLDGRNASGTELAACASLMWLTPAQDGLFTGPASHRRKFLDRFALAHFPDHGQAVLRYEKSRTQRNRLLGDNSDDHRWYAAIEADMARFAAQIALNRRATLLRLQDQILRQSDAAFPQAQIALDYDLGEGLTHAILEGDIPAAELEAGIKECLLHHRPLDRRAGRTLKGVHRTDLNVVYAAKAMPAADCSTGEQKALLLGLCLAQAQCLSQYDTGRGLILLLDEVAAHLDKGRRADLIEALLNLEAHIFMTGTDRSLFEAFGDRAQMFHVQAGDVHRA